MAELENRRVLLASPRGYCAGVERAVDTVEEALAKHGAPIYVRKQIVHNRHVVENLEGKGAIFVEENEEVPEGSIVVFSAHGVAPEVYQQAEERNLFAIDATCPLVTKVHNEAKRYAREDYQILLIGHEGHEEVVGTAGEAPEHITITPAPWRSAKERWLGYRRPPCRWTRQWPRWMFYGSGFRNSSIHQVTTSVTPPRIGSRQSKKLRRNVT